MPIDIENFYETYGPMVLRRCRFLLGNEALAQDAMHDVFVNVLRNQSRLTDVAPSSLLFRIATNVCLNMIRSQKRHPETREEKLLVEIAATASVAEQTASRSLLQKLFRREKASTQTIAVLHFLDEMTLEEVASEVGMSVSGVRKRLRGLRSRIHTIEETEL